MVAKSKKRHIPASETTYQSPEDLLDMAFQYFAWCDDNPLLRSEIIRSGPKVGEVVQVPSPRPYTLPGLYVYCRISEKTFKEFEGNEKFSFATEYIQDVVRQNQLEGIVANVFNVSAVSRLQSTDTQMQNFDGLSLSIRVNNTKTGTEIEELSNKLSDK